MADKRAPRGRPFQKGQSSNPAGRLVGSRNKLEESMLADFCAHWRKDGTEAIDKVFKETPAEYVKNAVQLLPKQVAVDATSQKVVYMISDG